MKKRIVSFLLVVLLCSCTACTAKEWWHKLDKTQIIFSDVLATPSLSNLDTKEYCKEYPPQFTYADDGLEHLPKLQLKYKKKDVGHIIIAEKYIYNEFQQKYILTPSVQGKGIFLINYQFYKDKEVSNKDSYILIIIVRVIIN